MTTYYNEHDIYAAQWLRNLIAAGHIAPGDVDERSIEDVRPRDLAGGVTPDLVLMVGSASDRSICDRLGKAPRPFPAKSCWQTTVFVQGAHALAYGQFLSHATPRTTHSSAARRDSVDRTVCSASQAASLSLSLRDISPPLMDAAHETLEPILRCVRGGRRQSTAIYCAVPTRLGNVCRTRGTCARAQQSRRRSLFCMRPCTCRNNIFGANAMAASDIRIECKVESSYNSHFVRGKKQ